jgi:predicted dehydrogenase
MINVGIVGSSSSISRHVNALGKIADIRITGSWIAGGVQESVLDAVSGTAISNPDDILENTDALILTDAGNFCNRLTTAALRNARHVFLYPAVVRSVNEVHQLIQLAREANVILKCGRTGHAGTRGLLEALPDISSISMIELQHYVKISGMEKSPKMSEALLSDMEILSHLIHARIISIKAKGLCMLTSEPEILNARLEFDNGCAVNYNSNLIAAQNEFFITIVAKNKILKYNFISGEYTGWLLHHTQNKNESPIFIESIRVEQTDSLWVELSDFISLIQTGPAFLSINDNGFESFILTDRILEKVMKTLVQCA